MAAGVNPFVAQRVLQYHRLTARDFLALEFEEAAARMPEIPRAQLVSAHSSTKAH